MATWKNRSEMKIVGINLGMLVLYTTLVNVITSQSGSSGSNNYKFLSTAMGLMFLIGFHVLADLLIGLGLWLRKRRETADGYFLSAAVVLAIGLSLCWGSLALSV